MTILKNLEIANLRLNIQPQDNKHKLAQTYSKAIILIEKINMQELISIVEECQIIIITLTILIIRNNSISNKFQAKLITFESLLID